MHRALLQSMRSSPAAGPFRFALHAASFLALLCAAIPNAQAGGKWVLKRDSDGIKIYTRNLENTDVKALRVTLTAPGTPALLAGILMNVPGQKAWVYSTRSSKVLKKISDAEVIYHSEKEMPWPVTDREAIINLKISHDPATRVMTVRAGSVAYPLPEKEGVIRVPSSSVFWRVTPTSDNTMSIEYEAQLDPGGSVPAWVTNMFITKGPYETFKKLKSMLQEGMQKG